MKKLFFALAIVGSIQVSGQVVKTSYLKWKDLETLQFLTNVEPRLRMSLARTGFTDQDSVQIYWHYRMEFLLVTHNLQDPERVELLYRNLILHVTSLQAWIKSQKLDSFRIWVRTGPGTYLKTDFGDPLLTGQRDRVQDRYFERYIGEKVD